MVTLPDMRVVIDEAVHAARVDPKDFRLVGPYEYDAILNRIVDRFTRSGRSSRRANWWWEDFKGEQFNFSMVNPMQTLSLLSQLVPTNERIWFVATDHAKGTSLGLFGLYEGTMGATIQVLNEMFVFEYYIVSKKYEWLLCYMHEEALIGVGQPIIARMKQLQQSGRA